LDCYAASAYDRDPVNPFDDRTPFLPNQELETLGRQSPPAITLAREELDRVAKLALLLTQEEFRRNVAAPRIVTPDILVPYEDRPEQTRAGSRTTVVRVLQALTMLGYLDLG
jgi:hypothetical protein